RNLSRIPIELVMWRELVVPPQFSRVGIQRNHRRAVQVVAHPVIAVVVRSWIPGAPISQIRLRIIGSRRPNWRTAVQPGIVRLPVLTLPRLATGFARARHGIKTPDFLAGVHVEGGHKATNTVLA